MNDIKPVAHRLFDAEMGYSYIDGYPSEYSVKWVANFGHEYEPLYPAAALTAAREAGRVEGLEQAAKLALTWGTQIMQPLAKAIRALKEKK